jgi:uncharacterized membrane protein
MDANRAYTGTVIRDAKGDFFLIKEETLAESKITDPELVKALRGYMESGDTTGYAEPVGIRSALPGIGAGFSALRVTPALKLKVC